ncbi:MAG: ThuA domain-containing protein, partial [Bacteroidota bacterium]
MNRSFLLTLCLAFFILSLHGQVQFKALLITKTQGWHHDALVAGVPAMRALAQRHHFQIDRHQDGERLNSDKLSRYDLVIMLSTTGDIFDEAEQAAFEA